MNTHTWTTTTLGLVVSLLAAVGLAFAQPASGRPGETGPKAGRAMEIQRHVLGNGLEVLVLENHSAPLVCSYIWYRVGLRNEGPGEAGLTHFLEHMAFKGTARMSGREMDRLVTEKGGYLNGFTSMDYTAYVETLPRDALELAFDIESERMTRCLLSAEDMESEKGVVLSEFEGKENDPQFLLLRRVMEEQFPGQPYGRTVIGHKDDLRGLTRETVEAYYRRHYAPDNAVLVVIGDVGAEEVFAKAEKFFGAIGKGEPPRPRPSPGRGPTGEKRVKLELPGRTSYVQAVYQVPPIDHADHAALEVVQNILSGGRTSRLYRALVDTGIASDAGGWEYENPEPTVFAFEIALRPGMTHEQGEKTLDEVLETLAREPVGERELTKAKNQTKAHFIYATDGVTKLAQQIGFYHLISNYQYLRAFPQRVDALRAEDIQRVVREYFRPENRTVGWLVATSEEGEGGAGGTGGQASLSTPEPGQGYRAEVRGSRPEPAALAPIAVPPDLGPVPAIHDLRLDNGMQVILQENHAAPFVAISGNIMAGPVFEAGEKAGMAAFCAEMLSRGTKKRSWMEIREALEFVAAELGFGIGSQVATMGGQCLTGDLELLLEATAEQLMEPAFPPEEIEKVRSEIIAEQEQRDEHTGQVAVKELLAHLYPEGHALHTPPLGTKETVESITREDLIAFHSQWYRPENTILAIVGDIEPDEVGALVERIFGPWARGGERARPELPQIPVPEEPQVIRVPIPNKTQVDIAVGFPGISRRDPAYYPADLMNYLLGHGFMSRLNMEIRDKLGLAYYVWSDYYAFWGPGPWVLRMGVNPANMDKALEAAVAELKRIQAESPSEEELKLWKDYVEGTVARRMETFAGIGHNLVLASFYDLGLYFPYEYGGILRAIIPAQVAEVAQRFLHPEGYVAVIAGPVEEAEKETAPEEAQGETPP